MKENVLARSLILLGASVINVIWNPMGFQTVKVGLTVNIDIWIHTTNTQKWFTTWFIGCNCNSEGSQGTSCDDRDGHCTCKSAQIFGNKCNKCVERLYGFPHCQGRVLLSIFLK